MDAVFGLDMQKDNVVHSISSVLLKQSSGGTPYMIGGITEVYIIGALVFAVFGYRYAKHQGQADPIQRFIPIQKDVNKDYLLAIKEMEAAAAPGPTVHIPKEEERSP